MEIAVVGCGGIGTIIAGDFARNGLKTYVVCKNEDIVVAIKNQGLQISGVSGTYAVKDNLVPILTIEKLPKTIDVVFIVTRVNQARDAIDRVKSHLSSESTFITMTNGIVEEALKDDLSPDYFLGCVVSFGATRKGPGEAVKTSGGEMVLGRLDGEKREIDDHLLQMLSYCVPTSWTTNILGYKLSKMLINSSVASFGVISGMTLGDLLKRKSTRLAFLTIVTEGVRVAKAKKFQLEGLNKFNFEFLALSKKEVQKFSLKFWIKDSILKILGRKYKNLRSVSLHSFEEGKKTEIDFINGYFARQGKKFGVDVRLNTFVNDLVKEIEQGVKVPSVENLESIEQETLKIWTS